MTILPPKALAYIREPSGVYTPCMVIRRVPTPPEDCAPEGMPSYEVKATSRNKGARPYGEIARVLQSHLVPRQAVRFLRHATIERKEVGWAEQFESRGALGMFGGHPLALDQSGRVCLCSDGLRVPVTLKREGDALRVYGNGAPVARRQPPFDLLTMTEAEAFALGLSAL